MTAARTSDDIGRVLGGRYRLIAPVGTGASARVYLADDVTLRRRVAVKLLHEGLAADETFLRRFRAEAQAAAALNHANILAVHDWGEDERGPFLVSEFLAGGSLRGLLDAGHRLTPSQATELGIHTARGLDHAHRRGLVHRDIKPANLLFDEDGVVRIADFGVARALAEAAWTEPDGVLVGSVRYASPEQARGEAPDGRADVFGLGLVLIEAVSGSVPDVGGDLTAHLASRAHTGVSVPEEVGPLRELLVAAVELDPADRPDARSFGQALWDLAPRLASPRPLPLVGVAGITDDASRGVDRTLHAHDLVPAAGPDPSGPDQPAKGGRHLAPRRRRRWPMVAGLVVVLGLLAGGFGLFTNAVLQSHLVPNLIDQTETAAMAVLTDESLGWDVEIQRRFQDGTEAGTVIGLEPAPGERLQEGRTLTLIVSEGPTPVDVPDLTDLTLDAAGSAIGDAGLSLGTVDRQPDEEIPVGVVISWSYLGAESPTTVPRGHAVDLVVSTGPAPRTVPDVSGLTFDAAEELLAREGLVAVEEEIHSNTVEKGKVVGTVPGTGATVPRDSDVTVQVSKGPDLVKVPDVSNDELDEAIEKLEDAGLVVGEIEGNPSRRVLTTDPPPGERVPRGSEVVVIMRGFLYDDG